MRNIVKYDTLTTQGNSIKSGNFNLGVNDTPSTLTGFYNGITPINGGYTIYINKASNGPSIYSPKNDDELIDIVKHLSGTVYSVNDALNWILNQSTMTVVNHNYPNIVTDGLVLNLDAGLVSSYPKNGTKWVDLSGNNNHVQIFNGPTFTELNGGSLLFDGTDDFADLPYDSSMDNGKLTLSVWIKSDFTVGPRSRHYIFDGVGHRSAIFVDEPNTLSFFVRTSSGFKQINYVNSIISSNTWLNIVGTYNGQSVDLYVNGSLVSSESYSGDVLSSTTPGRLMDYVSGTYETEGYVSSFMMYDRGLTSEEVQQNYYAGLQRLVPTDGLMISLNPTNTNLYATSPTTAYDISGEGNNGTLLNGVSVTSTNEGSWDFDGSNDYINIPFNSGGMDFSGGQTICMWLKPHTGASNARRNPYNQAYGGSGTITHEMSGVFSYYFGTNGGNGSPYVGRGTSFTVNENELAFIVVSRDQSLGTCKWYKNGVLSTTSTAGGYSSTNNGSSPITIGDGYTNNFVGDIFDVKVYNRGLTDDEVSIIYNSTKTKYE